jgi:hypothetical protein
MTEKGKAEQKRGIFVPARNLQRRVKRRYLLTTIVDITVTEIWAIR